MRLLRSIDSNQAGLFFLVLYALASSISIALSSIAIACSAVCALWQLYRQRTRPQLPRGFGYAWLFFFLTLAVSAVFAYDPGMAIARIGSNLWRMMPLVLAVVFLRQPRQLAWMVSALALSLAIADGAAIWQWLQGARRASAFGANAMIFAGYLVLLLPFLVALSCESSRFSRRFRVFCGSVAGVSVIALIANGTRGAWLAIAGAVLVYGGLTVKRQPKRAVQVLTVFFIIIAVMVANPATQQRLHSIVNLQSNMERIYLWKSAWQMFKEHPVIGVGTGNFAEHYQTRYILPAARERTLRHAHNNFLHILAESGAAGFSGFIGFFGYILYSAFRRFWQTREVLALAGLLATLSFLIQGLTEYNYGNSAVMRLYWALIGTMYAFGNVSSRNSDYTIEPKGK